VYSDFHLHTPALEFGPASKEGRRSIESSISTYIAVSKTERPGKWKTNSSSGGALPHEQPHELQ
jgi:hypothetical protein